MWSSKASSYASYVMQVLPWLIVTAVILWVGTCMHSYTMEKSPSGVQIVTQLDIYGLTFDSKQKAFFNWHPILMTAGTMLFLSNGKRQYVTIILTLIAILAYRVFPFSHTTNKAIHGAFHTTSILLLSLGVYAVATYHSNFNIPHLYSMHSWAGVAFLIIYGLNYIFGLISFGPFEIVSDSTRHSFLPLHAALGLSTYVIGSAVVVLGFAEKLSFNKSCNVTGLWNNDTMLDKALMSDCVYGNSIGMSVLFTMILVVLAMVLPKNSNSAALPSSERSVPSERQPLL